MTTSPSKKEALLIFQKNMILGKAKTRIAKSVGNEKAMDIYRKLVQFTHHVVSDLPSQKFIYFSDRKENGMPNSTGFLFKVQKGYDLGVRMSSAFDEIFAEGYEKAILIGTDCGEIDKQLFERAFKLLDQHDVVLGPAKDGGYYLVGMKKKNNSLFQDIDWSTNRVLNQTLQRISNEGLTYGLLPTLADVDTYEDWLSQMERVESFLIEE